MKTAIIVLLILVMPAAFAASKKDKAYGKVTYVYTYNGQPNPNSPQMYVEYSNNTAKVWQQKPSVKKLIPGYATESTVIDYEGATVFRFCSFDDGSSYYTSTAFDKINKVEFTGETRKILNYNCKKATTVINSNRIDIWYTEDAPIKGTPGIMQGLVPGLTLSIVRNGNSETIATKIEFDNKARNLIPENKGELKENFEIDAIKRNSTIITTPVFDNEQICWGEENSDVKIPQIGTVYRFAGGTLIVKKVKLPILPDHYSIFAEINQYSNGDAYDRTGSIFVIPQEKERSFWDGMTNGINTLPIYYDAAKLDYQGVVATTDYQPPVELVRFFTPFGIRHFNNRVTVDSIKWENSTGYKQDISDMRHYLQGEVLIGAFIGNYDRGGHKISLNIKAYPGSYEWDSPKSTQIAIPVFNTCNVMEMGGQRYGTMFDNDSLTVEFEIPQGAKNLRLRYITTGHGGWGGGDEFNPKTNEIFIDNQKVFVFTPWRTDCGAYRKYNPVSGNFWNGTSSSDLSRSGWCPGTATQPEYVDLKDLKPGKHTIKVAIPLGKPQGTSFSAWSVSGIIIGETE